MDISLQDCARYLAAPAGALSPDESTMRLIKEKDGNLIEEIWTGAKVTQQSFIASGVKKSTPAVYLLNENAGFVAFIDILDTLQYCQYDKGEHEWMPIYDLQSFAVHPDTTLSGCFDADNGSIIFFQGVSGQLKGVAISMTGEFRPAFRLPATTGIMHSPLIHSAFTSHSMIPHLLFISQGEIHTLKFDSTSQEWQEISRLGLGDYHITRFMVTVIAPLEVLALSLTGMLIRFNKTDRPTELVAVDSRFVAVTSLDAAKIVANFRLAMLPKRRSRWNLDNYHAATVRTENPVFMPNYSLPNASVECEKAEHALPEAIDYDDIERQFSFHSVEIDRSAIEVSTKRSTLRDEIGISASYHDAEEPGDAVEMQQPKDGGGQDHPPRDFRPVDWSPLVPMADQSSASEPVTETETQSPDLTVPLPTPAPHPPNIRLTTPAIEKGGFAHTYLAWLLCRQRFDPSRIISYITRSTIDWKGFMETMATVVSRPQIPVSLSKEDLCLLRLNKTYGLGRDVLQCIQKPPDQMENISTTLDTGWLWNPTAESTATVSLQWPLLQFLKSQFADAPSQKQKFGSIITLTGFATDAQAVTVDQYLSQTWPEIASKLLKLLPATLDSRISHSRVKRVFITPATTATTYYDGDSLVVHGVGNQKTVTQLMQAFTWLSCAIRAQFTSRGVWECIPIFSPVKLANQPARLNLFVVDQFMRQSSSSASSVQPGKCWQDMFQGAVIARGFPIPKRETENLGLEVPLSMLSYFGGSTRVAEWNDKIFIKGYSTMLVAVKCVANVLIWHYYYRDKGERLSYTDCTLETESLSIAKLEGCRHVIGWCTKSKYLAGSLKANYSIQGTELPRPSAGFFLEKVTISAGRTVGGGAEFTPGVKESPPQLRRKGIIPRLKWLRQRYVVFWDEGAKRGWLVNGTSALLHLIRASLEHCEKDDFSAGYMFDKTKMNNNLRNQHQPNSAIAVLIDEGNQGLPIYLDKITQRRETFTDSGTSSNRKTTGFFLFGDLVDQHVSALEDIIEHHAHLAGRNGVNLKTRVRKHLEGWDFIDLVTDCDLVPRATTIPALGHGWVDFIRSIGAITLFGRDFGELIQPEASVGLCSRWASLPTQDCFLAASAADLQRIMERHGDPHSTPRKLAHNVLWHSPPETCATCPCQQPNPKQSKRKYHVDPVQVLFPSGGSARRTIGQWELEQAGAVVFGHNAVLGYRWPDRGTDEVVAKDWLVPLRNRLPVRLFSKTTTELPDVPDASNGKEMNHDSEETVQQSESSTSANDSGETLVHSASLVGDSPTSSKNSFRDLISKRRKVGPLLSEEEMVNCKRVKRANDVAL